MKIGIIGSGHIGGNAGRLFAKAGHEVLFSGSRDPAKLEAAAAEAGNGARTGSPREAVEFGEVVVVAVPWRALDELIDAVGSFAGRIVVDTTNQFGAGGVQDLSGRTAAEVNAGRMTGARYTKSFNTLTSGFQAETAGRSDADRVALFVAGDDADAKRVVLDLIEGIGFAAVDAGTTAQAAFMEPPRRPGAVYGEEYREPDAREAVEAAASGRPLPPAPAY